MDIKRLETAISEAERFIRLAKLAKARQDKDWEASRGNEDFHPARRNIFSNVSAENAACKRASLDLTRALAELRK